MSLRTRDTAALRTATEVYLRGSSGSHPIDRMMMRTDAGVSEFYRRGLRPFADPSIAEGSSSARAGPVTTNTVVVSVSGGTAPYSHLWSSANGIAATAPSSATTAFRGSPPAFSGYLYAVLTDTITDANGLTSTVSVEVSLTRESGV